MSKPLFISKSNLKNEHAKVINAGSENAPYTKVYIYTAPTFQTLKELEKRDIQFRPHWMRTQGKKTNAQWIGSNGRKLDDGTSIPGGHSNLESLLNTLTETQTTGKVKPIEDEIVTQKTTPRVKVETMRTLAILDAVDETLEKRGITPDHPLYNELRNGMLRDIQESYK